MHDRLLSLKRMETEIERGQNLIEIRWSPFEAFPVFDGALFFQQSYEKRQGIQKFYGKALKNFFGTDSKSGSMHDVIYHSTSPTP